MSASGFLNKLALGTAVLCASVAFAQRPDRRNPGDGGDTNPASADNVCSVTADEVVLRDNRQKVDSMDKCHDVAFAAGDRYCSEARAGRAGSNPFNPINLTYTWNGQSRSWEFSCENVATNRKPKARDGNGTGRAGDAGRGQPLVRAVESEYTEAFVRGSLPDNICLLEHEGWSRDWRRDSRNFTIDREDAFCDWDERRLRFDACRPTDPPPSSIVPNSTFWTGDSRNVSLGNRGEAVSVSITSRESQKEQYFENTASGYNCSEPAGTFRVDYVRYRVVRNAATNEVISREPIRNPRNGDERERRMIRGIRLMQDPVWSARTRSVPTENMRTSTFVLETQPYETHLDLPFAATIRHTEGSVPSVSFSDEFFSHRASFGNIASGGTIRVSSSVSPVRSPRVAITGMDTEERTPRLSPLEITDRALARLRYMSPDIETSYKVSGRLLHERSAFRGGDELLATFEVPVPNPKGDTTVSVDLESLLRAEAERSNNRNLLLDRDKNSYKLKLTVTASRKNSKFVAEGESESSGELTVRIDKNH